MPAARSIRFPWFSPAGRSPANSAGIQAYDVASAADATAPREPRVPGDDHGDRAADPTARAGGTNGAVRQFFDEGFLRRLDRLQLVSQRMHGAASHGGRRSKKRGTSVEFADYREYTPGDDLRQIDWNIYGRSDRLFVKLREDEESLTVHLLIDCSKSMDWGRHHKLSYARRLAAVLGYVALASQDRVEAAAFGSRLLSHVPPLRGKGQLGRLLTFLTSLEPRGQTDLKASLAAYAAMHRRSGLVILISDLLNPGGLEGLTALLDRGFEAVLIHLLDPTEIDPEDEGEVELRDRETGEILRISLDPSTVDAYRRRLAGWLAETEAFCAKRMVRYVTASTALPLEDLTFRQLRARRILS
ncbi:MAG: DUF58 domain-containing protein [Chloroflexi bacterium]|nr:DUF58 domain-containing protein [Chloroflexota bacterium]